MLCFPVTRIPNQTENRHWREQDWPGRETDIGDVFEILTNTRPPSLGSASWWNLSTQTLLEPGSGHGEQTFQYGGTVLNDQYGGIHFNTEYPVLNDQAEHNTGEQGNNIYGDKIKCPGTPLVPGAAVCVHVEGGGA